jgi:predicted GIY-YIG superfamily endonuclease
VINLSEKRTYKRYELKGGRKVVYVGITDNPERRESEHRQDGKKFTKMNVIGSVVTQNSAEKWEEERLQSYRKHHGGKNPKYNKTDK